MNRASQRLLVATLIITGCTHSKASRVPAHDGATPVLSTSQFNWIELGYEDFRKYSQPAPFRTGEKLKANDIISKRFQAWADRLHTKVKADYEAQAGQPFTVPAPKVVILPASEANAWASGVAVCFKVPVRVASAGLNTKKTTGVLHLEADNYYERKPNPFNPSPVNCYESKTSVHQFIAWFNSFNGKCRLEAEGQGVVIRGDGCASRFGADEATEASGIEYYAISNYIHFTSAMVALSASEEGAIATLAHELGHYYRTHTIGMLIGKRYDCWYQQSVPPRPGLPIKLADSDRYAATLERLMPYPMPVLEGRQFAYVLRDFLTSRMYQPLKNACGNVRKCACREALRMLDDSWRYEFSAFVYSVPEETKRKYLEFERVLQTCAPSMPIANRQEWIQAYSTSFAAKFVKNLPLGDNLAVILETLNEKAMEADRELQEFEAGLVRERIGYYTSEQEADDFAVEYVSKIGLDPMTANLEKFKQYQAREGFDAEDFSARNGGVSFEGCLQRRESGWSQPVPIGSLTDIHHGGCYRLFNMDQEALAHGWKASDEPKPAFKGTWTDVLKRAREVTPSGNIPAAETIQPPDPSGRVYPSSLIIN